MNTHANYQKVYVRDSKMADWVEALALKAYHPELDPQNSRSEERTNPELTSDLPMYAVVCIHPLYHTYKHT